MIAAAAALACALTYAALVVGYSVRGRRGDDWPNRLMMLGAGLSGLGTFALVLHHILADSLPRDLVKALALAVLIAGRQAAIRVRRHKPTGNPDEEAAIRAARLRLGNRR